MQNTAQPTKKNAIRGLEKAAVPKMKLRHSLLLSLLLTCTALAAQETDLHANEQVKPQRLSLSKGEQLAVDQLRAITDEIKRCPETQLLTKDGSRYMLASPRNVVWNTKQNYSSRSEMMGYIELVQTSTYSPKALEVCRKRDQSCSIRNENTSALNSVLETVSTPDQYRYEFDINQNGLEPVQAFYKHQTDAKDQWLAGSFGDDCVGKSISVILNDPGRRHTSSEQDLNRQ